MSRLPGEPLPHVPLHRPPCTMRLPTGSTPHLHPTPHASHSLTTHVHPLHMAASASGATRGDPTARDMLGPRPGLPCLTVSGWGTRDLSLALVTLDAWLLAGTPGAAQKPGKQKPQEQRGARTLEVRLRFQGSHLSLCFREKNSRDREGRVSTPGSSAMCGGESSGNDSDSCQPHVCVCVGGGVPRGIYFRHKG